MSGETEERGWYRVAFGDLYPVLYAHRNEAAARSEASFAVANLRLRRGGHVLDLACGGGRHQHAVQADGIHVVGLDLSGQLLERNRRDGGERIVRGDMRELPFAAESFDAVTSFFTSFGYFESDDEDARVLEGVFRVLRPGGRYLLDYLYEPQVVDNLQEHSERIVAGHRMVEERRIEDLRVKKRVTITPTGGGEAVRYEESVRLYEPDDLQAMCKAAGFHVRGTFGAFDGRPLGSGDRCLLVLERRQ